MKAKEAREELKEILKLHTLWLEDKSGGRPANLQNADLRYADLQNADLRHADLRHVDLWYADLRHVDLQNADLRHADLRYADLRYVDLWYADLRHVDLQNADLQNADLRHADLRHVDLWYADLRHVDLQNADLRYADLRYADLRYADLRHVDLRCADLQHADLRYADLRHAKLEGVCVSEKTQGYFLRCPEVGAFTAFKKCANESIVTLEIPGDAKRSSATGNKCRCDKARVVAIEDIYGNPIKEAISNYNKNFIYRVGETVKVDNFNEDRWAECAPGIHFYITKKEAKREINPIK